MILTPEQRADRAEEIFDQFMPVQHQQWFKDYQDTLADLEQTNRKLVEALALCVETFETQGMYDSTALAIARALLSSQT